MKTRLFGQRTGLFVSELVLGTGLFGKAGGYGAEPADIESMLRGYADAGGNFLDTADAYQRGASETVVGQFVAHARDAFVIASKYCRTAAERPAAAAVGAHRKAMVQSVEASLGRLQTDRIDIYLVHLDDGATPIDEIARGLDDLVRAGKIVYAGLSNFPAWRVAAAATLADLRGWAPIAAIQVEYSLLQRTTERELLPMAAGHGLGVMGYGPLAAGLLTAKYRHGAAGRATDFAASVPHAREPHEPVLDALVDIASELGASANPGRVALAWVRAKGVFPIIGPRTPAQLADNLAATELVLSAAHVDRLDVITAPPLGYPHELLATARAQLRR